MDNEGLSVGSVIVLYHPDLVLLDRVLHNIADQVKRLYVIDNTPGEDTDCGAFLRTLGIDIDYVSLRENKGIALAQNIGIRKAIEDGVSHVLLLDQDSQVPPGMVSGLLDAEMQLKRRGEAVAAVAPAFVDQKTAEVSPVIRHEWLRVKKVKLDQTSLQPVEADYVISSGSLISAESFRQVGLMREELFIDWVDIEWGLRAKQKNLNCFVVPNITMQHSIGDASVQIMGRSINLHSDVRHYYLVRNATYLLGLKTMGLQWRSATMLKIPLYIIFYPWHSRNRFKSLLLLIRAFADGLRRRMGCFQE
jgi:rhamnosyltransferase